MSLLFLALGNTALGAALVYTRSWPVSLRAYGRKTLGVFGILLSLSLIDWGREGLGWRSITLGPEEALLCGVAIAGCWTLIVHGAGSAANWIIGAAAAALILMVGADWIVPHLLFSLILFWAFAAGGVQTRASTSEIARPLVALVLIAAGGIVMSLSDGGWLLPGSAAVPERWLLLLGAVVAVIGFPSRQESTGSSGLGEPLLVAAGFSLLPRLADGAPYQGAVLLGAAVLLTIFPARRVTAVAAPLAPLLVLMAAALLAPRSVTAAGLGAVLIATAAGAGRMIGDPFRATLVALAPLTVGFAAIGLAAEEALTRAALSQGDQVGWVVVAILFPLALATCMRAGISAGRSAAFEPPAQVRVTALVLAISIVLLVTAAPVAGISGIVSGGGTVLLLLTAVTAGVVATVHFAGSESATFEPSAASQQQEEIAASTDLPKRPRAITVALVLGAVTLGMVGYVTFQGLRVGFL